MEADRQIPYVPPSKAQKLLNKIMFFSLGVAFVCMAVLGYWTVTGTDALTFQNKEVPVISKTVTAGTTVAIRATFCKSTDRPGRVVRKLVGNGTETLVLTTTEVLDAKCYTNYPLAPVVPEATAPGIYYFNYRITYNINPLHRSTVEEFNTEKFTVE